MQCNIPTNYFVQHQERSFTISTSATSSSKAWFNYTNAVATIFIASKHLDHGTCRINFSSKKSEDTIVLSEEFGKDKNLQKIDSISALQKDWDGRGARKFSKKVIRRSKEIIGILVHQPEVFPVPDGELQFEYNKADGTYLEFTTMRFGRRINVFKIDRNGKEYYFKAKTNQLNKLVNDFYG